MLSKTLVPQAAPMTYRRKPNPCYIMPIAYLGVAAIVMLALIVGLGWLGWRLIAWLVG